MVGQKYKNLTLIARGKRGEALREHGVVLHSDFHGEKIVKDGVIRECAREVEEIQDLIFFFVLRLMPWRTCARHWDLV